MQQSKTFTFARGTVTFTYDSESAPDECVLIDFSAPIYISLDELAALRQALVDFLASLNPPSPVGPPVEPPGTGTPPSGPTVPDNTLPGGGKPPDPSVITKPDNTLPGAGGDPTVPDNTLPGSGSPSRPDNELPPSPEPKKKRY